MKKAFLNLLKSEIKEVFFVLEPEFWQIITQIPKVERKLNEEIKREDIKIKLLS